MVGISARGPDLDHAECIIMMMMIMIRRRRRKMKIKGDLHRLIPLDIICPKFG